TVGVFFKKYPQADGYCLEVDIEKQTINYGNLIISDSKTTQNFSQPENFVVLECVNRLLEKGYKPQNIILEKTWAAGHGTSGRLDICVTRDNGDEYLLIECKTYGKEFEKAFTRMKKDGGQLFTYFKFSNKADVIMLYASELKGHEIVYNNEIIKIEDDYRTGDVKDFYERWNKLTKDNGVFDSWVRPYNFECKALIPDNLQEIKPEDSSLIFNQFLEILRHNVVSDKPNAFNKIFTLFLCKILDEKNTKPNEELAFQWFYTPYQYEGISYPPDNHISFQKRLTDLYKKGMREFLEKEVTDISDAEFEKKYDTLGNDIRKQLLDDLTEIRLKKNNEFAIKEVFDDDSFEENAKVVKEVVELLQGYKIRYAAKQQYLSDFFELLLTTGLKQESGQYFTPVPVAQFIIKSLPVDTMVHDKLQKGIKDEFLPHIIDYAAGSGHFITESMHLLQQLLGNLDNSKLFGDAKKLVAKAKDYPYDWAMDYVYGVEKDYRLVKVGKVGCYLHGDGLARVIHSDGLGNFKHTKEYKGLLLKTDKDFPQENRQFDILVSNPPYSVSAFKNNAVKFYGKEDFELYNSLTDNSSEIECLFVERMKQLLKNGGVAGVILPSSILNNEGIYTKAREIILRYFEIVAITELGSNTFMATGTNTVVLFLRRRSNYDSINLRKSIDRFFDDFRDVTRNGIEKPVAQYVNHVWETLAMDDYITLLKKEPSHTVTNHEIYKEYRKKIKAKTEKDFWNTLIETEKEKLHYFILAYPQKVVLVKTGEKDAEKRFLGYEFSNRRGSEGIHPIQRGKTINECTCLFDDERFDNPEKASTYIYKAFAGDYDFPIHESLKDHILRVRLVDMLTFDRDGFAKSISTAVKKKVKIESKWNLVQIGDFLFENDKSNIKVRTAKEMNKGEYPFFTSGETVYRFNDFLTDNQNIYLSTGGNAIVKFYDGKAAYSTDTFVIKSNNEEVIKTKFIFYYLESIISIINEFYFKGVGLKHLQKPDFRNMQIPLPPKEIQQKIVSGIEVLEKKEAEAKEKIRISKNIIRELINTIFSKYETQLLGNLCDSVEYGTSAKSEKTGDIPVIRMGNIQDGKIDWNDLVYTNNPDEISKYSLNKYDVLFNRTNSPELVGKVGIYKGERPAIFAGYLIRINYKKDLLNPVFLTYVLNSETIRNHGFSVMSKSVNQANINGTLLKSYKIPYPPLSEQQKIVSEIEKIEVHIAEAQKIIDDMPMLKNEILKKYL
ncbi:MAG: restriction endonuclease subunit S, partial [Prevotellaceae bacterium]|nr:restriction endonuclease subunit S [Prevotellaceae bacterium]